MKKKYLNYKIALSIGLLALIVATPSIIRSKNKERDIEIQHDTIAVSNAIQDELLKEDSKIINAKVKSAKTEKIYINGIKEEKEDNKFNKFIENEEVYQLDKKIITEKTGTKLKGDFYTNIGGDVFYLTDSSGVEAVGGEEFTSTNIINGVEEAAAVKNLNNTDDIKTLKDRIRDLRNQISRLKNVIAGLEVEIKDILNSRSLLEEDMKRIETQIAELNKQLEQKEIDYNKAIDEKEEKIKDLKSELEKNSDNVKIKEDIEELEDEIIKIEKDNKSKVDKLNDERDELEKSLTPIRNEIKDLTNKVNKLEDSVSKKEIEKTKINNKMIEQSNEIDKLKADIKEKSDKIIELNKLSNEKLEELANSIKANSDEVTRLNSEIEKKTADLNAVNEELKETKANNTGLTNKIKDLEKDKAELESKLSDAKSKNDILNAKKELIANEIAGIKKELAESEKTEKQLSEQVIKMEKDKANTEEEVKVIKGKIAKEKETISTLSKTNTELKEKVREIEDSNKLLQEEVESLTNNLKELKDSNALEVKGLEEKLNKLSEDKKELVTELEGLKTSIEKSNKDILEIENSIKDVKGKETQVKSNIAIKVSELKDKKTNKDKIEGDIETVNASILELKTSKDTLTKNLDDKTKELTLKQDEKSKKETELANAKTSNTQINKDIEQLDLKIKELDTAEKALKAEKEKIDTELTNIIKEIEVKNNELKELETDITKEKESEKTLINEITALKATEVKLNSDIKSRENDKTAKTDILNKKNAEIKNLNEKEKTLTTEKNKLTESKTSKTKELSELDKKIVTIEASIKELETINANLDKNKALLLNDATILIDAILDGSVYGYDENILKNIDALLGEIDSDVATAGESLNKAKGKYSEKLKVKENVVKLEKEIFEYDLMNGLVRVEEIKKEIEKLPEGRDKIDLMAKANRLSEKIMRMLKIKQVSLGSFHSAALTEDGQVYTWGSGDYGRLGHGDEENKPTPELVTALSGKKVVQISLRAHHSAALTEDGQVYTWGSGDYGKLGHGDEKNKLTPTLVTALSGKKIVQVSLGHAHSAVLTEDGKLYTWGWGKYGRLGHGDSNDKSTPELVTALSSKKVVQISLGDEHSAALTEDGQVYTWARGSSGELGHGDNNDKSTPTLVKIPNNKKTVQVSLGGAHSVALTEDGKLYTWGSGSLGRLGHGNTEDKYSPKQIEKAFDGKKVVQVALGGYHSAAITEDGQVYTWGSGDRGQLGHDDEKNQLVPKQIEKAFNGKKVVQVALGHEHSAALTEDGEAYTWGKNNKQQLGLNNIEDSPIPRLIKPKSFSKLTK